MRISENITSSAHRYHPTGYAPFSYEDPRTAHERRCSFACLAETNLHTQTTLQSDRISPSVGCVCEFDRVCVHACVRRRRASRENSAHGGQRADIFSVSTAARIFASEVAAFFVHTKVIPSVCALGECNVPALRYSASYDEGFTLSLSRSRGYFFFKLL